MLILIEPYEYSLLFPLVVFYLMKDLNPCFQQARIRYLKTSKSCSKTILLSTQQCEGLWILSP